MFQKKRKKIVFNSFAFKRHLTLKFEIQIKKCMKFFKKSNNDNLVNFYSF